MWQIPPTTIALTKHQADVWKADLNISAELQAEFREILSVEEKVRADRFRFPEHRAHFIAGRGILRHLLAKYVQRKPKDLVFGYGAQGKPFLVDYPGFAFNISHSRNIGLFAFAHDLILGVDIEMIDPTIEFEVIAPRFFSKNESDTLMALPIAERPLAFFNCWTRKEAFIKAKGGGLSIPLDQFEVSFLPDTAPELLAINWAMDEVPDWSLYAFTPEYNMVGALIVRGEVNNVSYYNFSGNYIL